MESGSDFSNSFMVVDEFGDCFTVRVEYEWVPRVYSGCHFFGHTVNQCVTQLGASTSSAHEKSNVPANDRKNAAMASEWVVANNRKTPNPKLFPNSVPHVCSKPLIPFFDSNHVSPNLFEPLAQTSIPEPSHPSDSEKELVCVDESLVANLKFPVNNTSISFSEYVCAGKDGIGVQQLAEGVCIELGEETGMATAAMGEGIVTKDLQESAVVISDMEECDVMDAEFGVRPVAMGEGLPSAEITVCAETMGIIGLNKEVGVKGTKKGKNKKRKTKKSSTRGAF